MRVSIYVLMYIQYMVPTTRIAKLKYNVASGVEERPGGRGLFD